MTTFKVEELLVTGTTTAAALAGTSLGFSATAGGTADVILTRDAANTLALRNGTTTPQILRVYNSYTGANNEWMELAWVSNTAQVRAMATGTGTLRDLYLQYGNATGSAIKVGTAINGGLQLAINASTTALTSGRVIVGNGANCTATSGATRGLFVYETYGPTASSTMTATPITVSAIVNYQGGGTGSYTALAIGITETAVPTGQCYMLRASGGATGATDVFSVTNGGTLATGRATITYAASMTPNASQGSQQTITITNGTAFTINAPTNPLSGQQVTFLLRNTSGGAAGVATWNAVFKMAAWVQPATANSRAITFSYDGTNWVEMSRTPADVPT